LDLTTHEHHWTLLGFDLMGQDTYANMVFKTMSNHESRLSN